METTEVDIQTSYTIEIGEEFNFFGNSKVSLNIGSVVNIHNFQEPIYGKSKVIEVLQGNTYKGVRIQ